MPVKKILVFSAAILVFLAACGKDGKKAGEEKKEEVKTTELPAELPKGHPPIEEMQKGITPAVELPSGQVQKQAGESHPKSKAELSVKVSDKIKARCFFQAEDGIRDDLVTGVQTCALPI